MGSFDGRRIVLGVTGSIATYKAVALASRLVQAGAVVDVIMSASARRMVQPLSFQAITHRPVQDNLWAEGAETEIGHVTLAREADLLLVAPATAHTIAKIALGLADNYLTTTALALRGPLVLAPAMESHMWEHPATQGHLRTLRERGVWIVAPGTGYLASGASGVGRLAEEAQILQTVAAALSPQDLAGQHLLITAGGTREPIDPVRYLGNHSSGRMGHTLAAEARRRGARVTLVTTAALPVPADVFVVRVENARQMETAVLDALPASDALLMAAAVADYRPATTAPEKIKKGDGPMTLSLVRNPDILLSVRAARNPQQVVVGWAAESSDLVDNARGKLERKGLDLIVANQIPDSFGDGRVAAVLVRPGSEIRLEPMSKRDLAQRLLTEVAALLNTRKRSAS